MFPRRRHFLRYRNEHFLRVLKYGLTLFGLGALLIILSTAVHANTPKQQSSPSIDFLEDRDFLVDFDWLNGQGDVLTVTLRNNLTNSAQSVTVRLVPVVPLTGTTNVNLGAISGDVAFTQSLVPLQIGEFPLKFTIAKDRPAAGNYQGTLIAIGSAGGLVRRSFTLHVAVPTPTPEPAPTGSPVAATPVPAAVRPDVMDSVTLTGIDPFPSILNPLSRIWYYVSFTVLIFACIICLSRMRNGPLRKILWRYSLIALVVLIIAGFAVQTLGSSIWIGAVSVSPADSNLVALGGINAPDGSLGSLVLDKGQLTVQDIQRAGKYTGQIDLIPADDDRGTVKVTVNVADFWLWAFLAVTAGASLAYKITDYYQRQRPIDLHRDRAKRINDRVEADQAKFDEEHSDSQLVARSITRLVQEWTNKSDENLTRTDIPRSDAFARATSSLDLLETYVESFNKFRADMIRLEQERINVSSEIKSPPVEDEQIDVFRDVKTVLNEPVLTFTVEEDLSSDLKKRRDKIEALSNRLQALKEYDVVIRSYVEDARNTDVDGPGWHDSDRKTMREQIRLLEEARVKSLRALDIPSLENANVEAYDARRVILALPKKTEDEPVPSKREATQELTEREGMRILDVRDVRELSARGHMLFIEGNFAWDRDRRRGNVPGIVVLSSDPHSFTAREKEDEREQERKVSRRLRLTDAEMAWITGIIAVTTGFVSLYLVNPGWGAPADYLNAFLWGSVVSQGLKLVSNVVNRLGLTA